MKLGPENKEENSPTEYRRRIESGASNRYADWIFPLQGTPDAQTLPLRTANAMGAPACPFSAQQVMQKVHRLTDN
jgi:hypothetical protein